jgi:hypothetical protein
MSGSTLFVIGLVGFLMLFVFSVVEQRRVATTFRQRLLLPLLALIVPLQSVLVFWGADENIRFVIALALCLFVLIGFIILAITGIRGGSR